MKWYKFRDPEGQEWYVQASDPESALRTARQNQQGRGYGATDLQSIQIEGEIPNFDMRDPAYGGRVYPATSAVGQPPVDGVVRKDGDVTTPGWTWRTIDGKLVETKDTSGFNPGTVPGGLENIDAEAAYLNALAEQGQNPEGRFGGYLRGLQSPTQALFNWNSMSGKLPADDYANADDAFSRFSTRTPFSDIRGLATKAFKEIATPGNAINADTALFMNQYRDPYATAEGADYEANYGAADEVLGLGRQAAASKYTPFTANRFLSSDDRIKERYARQGYRGDFMDFAKKYLGLSTGF